MKIKLFITASSYGYYAPFEEKEFEFTRDAAIVLLAAVKGEGWGRGVSAHNRIGDQVTVQNPSGEKFSFTLTSEWVAVHMSAENSLRAEGLNTPRLEEALFGKVQQDKNTMLQSPASQAPNSMIFQSANQEPEKQNQNPKQMLDELTRREEEIARLSQVKF